MSRFYDKESRYSHFRSHKLFCRLEGRFLWLGSCSNGLHIFGSFQLRGEDFSENIERGPMGFSAN